MGEYTLNIDLRGIKRPLVIEERRINFDVEPELIYDAAARKDIDYIRRENKMIDQAGIVCVRRWTRL